MARSRSPANRGSHRDRDRDRSRDRDRDRDRDRGGPPVRIDQRERERLARSRQNGGGPPPPPPPPGGPRGAPPQRRPDPVDRAATCPLLLRTFVKRGRHHSSSDFARGAAPTADEVPLHGWQDTSLYELKELLKGVHPAARERGLVFSFSQVYPDKRGALVLREVGSCLSLKRGNDDAKTLAELQFMAGDHLDIALLPDTS